MIVIWPLIVSKTVNPNILPGVCKALEKYIYIEQMDDVIEAANQNIKQNASKANMYIALKSIGGKSKLRLEHMETGKTIEDYLTEDWSFLDDWEVEESLAEAKKSGMQQVVSTRTDQPASGGKPTQQVTTTVGPKPPGPLKPKKQDVYKDALAQAKAKGDYDKATRNEEPKFGRMDADSITTEPTWNTVTDQQGNTKAIGVKVVPFVINNEESLIKLMMSDRYRGQLSKNTHKQARKILRFMQRIANVTWKKTIGFLFSWTGFVKKDLVSGTVSKNWKNDIILQNTYFKDRMFILLNKMDLTEDFTQSASGVKKLFTLGWTSIIIADDVNKVATFCMKTYRGMCSMVNYGFLYADSRSQAQVYSDIEDIRKSSGPLFRMARRRETMITDNLANYKLDQYSQDILISESYLKESLAPELMKKIKDSPKSIANSLKAMSSAFKRNDLKTTAAIAKKLNPSNKLLEINKMIDKTFTSDQDFRKNFELAKIVFKNSLPGLDDDSIKVGAALMGGIASLHKNKKYDMKSDLKKVVMNTRLKTKSLKEDNDEFAHDLKIAFAFSLVTLFLTTGVITVALYYIVLAIPATQLFVVTVWPFVLTTIIIVYFIKMVSGASEGASDD